MARVDTPSADSPLKALREAASGPTRSPVPPYGRPGKSQDAGMLCARGAIWVDWRMHERVRHEISTSASQMS